MAEAPVALLCAIAAEEARDGGRLGGVGGAGGGAGLLLQDDVGYLRKKPGFLKGVIMTELVKRVRHD